MTSVALNPILGVKAEVSPLPESRDTSSKPDFEQVLDEKSLRPALEANQGPEVDPDSKLAQSPEGETPSVETLAREEPGEGVNVSPLLDPLGLVPLPWGGQDPRMPSTANLAVWTSTTTSTVAPLTTAALPVSSAVVAQLVVPEVAPDVAPVAVPQVNLSADASADALTEIEALTASQTQPSLNADADVAAVNLKAPPGVSVLQVTYADKPVTEVTPEALKPATQSGNNTGAPIANQAVAGALAANADASSGMEFGAGNPGESGDDPEMMANMLGDAAMVKATANASETEQTASTELQNSSDRQHIIRQVAERLENALTARHAGTVTIRLATEAFGDVNILLNVDGNQVKTDIQTNDKRLAAALVQQRPELVQRIESKGFSLTEFNVGQDGAHQQNPSFGGQRFTDSGPSSYLGDASRLGDTYESTPSSATASTLGLDTRL
ncbi:MAG: flagellar hook-length control protein FliK [Fimbriimonadaceae bacterium]